MEIYTVDGVSSALLWGLLGFVIFPLWLAAGAADFICHARTDIAQTSGVRESVLHLLQTAQMGLPIIAILFLEVDASVLVLAFVASATHTATAYWDLSYTAPLRPIPPVEQFLHAFLIVLPLVGLAIICVLHWPQTVSLLSPGSANWSLHLRTPRFAPWVIAAVIAASLLIIVAPGLLELRRTLRARHGRAATP
ncbi:diguanylate cyclase [Lysobacter ciconiae]|uniref:Diguanylate cyclase n=1 Tax=Novilysobacter ciconiae TaxID=2781022 RepID=A0A7S6UDZ4_9GAMM|nr:diguanylate cyclase [Lysobacter ciconiae]QOW18516.1 diguanylate cyclase [Lysobacter ciconiae]